MLRLVVNIEGLAEFDRTFTRFTANLRDWRELWPAVIGELRRITQEQFAFEGKGTTGQWRQLSPKYAQWKELKFPGSTILSRTGRLVKSLTRRSGDSIIIGKPDLLIFGTSVPYAIYHQSRRARKKLPRRPIFDFSEDDKNRLTKAIQRALFKAGKNQGVAIRD